MPISLGKMPGIPGLGGQAKVGQSQRFNNFSLLPQERQITFGHQISLDEDPHQEQ